MITLCCFIVNAFTTGLQLSFGVLHGDLVDHCKNATANSNSNNERVWSSDSVAVDELQPERNWDTDAGKKSILLSIGLFNGPRKLLL